jgi:hypothetical protein
VPRGLGRAARGLACPIRQGHRERQPRARLGLESGGGLGGGRRSPGRSAISQLNADRYVAEIGHGKGDAALAGPAASLLLVLVRRRPVSDPAVTVHGDSAVVDGWLAGTPF